MDADLRERVAKAMWESRTYRGGWPAMASAVEQENYRLMAVAALSVAQGQGWLPIENAPRDAAYWLVWSSEYGRPMVVTQRTDDGRFWKGDWTFDVHATHWHKLPAAPAQPDGVE